MKKILTIICLGLLIGAAIPVSASADKLDQIAPKEYNQLLPKTNDKQNFFSSLIGISLVLSVALFYYLKKQMVMRRKNEK